MKTILALNNSDKDSILNEFIVNFTNAVNLYCGTETLPKELEFVVVECTIARYNRLGSEGLSQEQIDSIGSSYQSNIITPYLPYMDSYKNSRKKVKFL
ncbi:phage head-tail connector protein [Neobacillus sedimentimangrovi]|uniref:Phage head-tail connector protein n=1 Tax=Neobacillus sedimentimangrovi TaxID=2699460 RepID=A0ABS8QKB4_9BACI|nr:phage head-tail connector protein [Neobacillus sedimentimangrovi]